MSETRDFFKQQLVEMGFDEKKVDKALAATNSESVERAAEWIISHEGDDEQEEATINVETAASQDASNELSNELDDEGNPSKAKTPEEIEAEKKKLEELIKIRRREREEREKQDEIEREKARRGTGREITKLREMVERKEQLQLIEQRKKDKQEDQAYLKRLREQIAADRAAQKERFANPSQNSPQKEEPPKPSVPITLPKTESNTCKLAIRLPDGSSLQQEFKSRESLAAVKLFVQLNRKDMPNDAPDSGNIQFKIAPATVFTDEDMDRPLVDLGLCPSSRLIAVQKKSPVC